MISPGPISLRRITVGTDLPGLGLQTVSCTRLLWKGLMITISQSGKPVTSLDGCHSKELSAIASGAHVDGYDEIQ